MVIHLSFRLITSGSRSAHLACRVKKEDIKRKDLYFFGMNMVIQYFERQMSSTLLNNSSNWEEEKNFFRIKQGHVLLNFN